MLEYNFLIYFSGKQRFQILRVGKHQHRKNKLRNHVIQATSCTYTANFKLDSPIDKISRRGNLFYDFHIYPLCLFVHFCVQVLKNINIYIFFSSNFYFTLIKYYERVDKVIKIQFHNIQKLNIFPRKNNINITFIRRINVRNHLKKIIATINNYEIRKKKMKRERNIENNEILFTEESFFRAKLSN